ncbi:MAG: TlpA family protein disulfide reductase [Flavobacteriaceae bacterium]|nr:TlpA family protein disulfide reductase [Flavobacteriaceae bacterium]
MALSKSQRSNLIFFGIIALMLFTPIVQKVKMFIFSPSIENIENRVVISNYKWNLKGINTTDYNFEKANGKVAFVNFWATWCPPCRAEMPSIQKLYDDYKDKIEFIFQTDEAPTTVIDFLNKNNYSLPSYNEFSKPPSEFKVTSIPATYLLNKKGEIVIHSVGAENWNSNKIRKLLDELLNE